MESEEMDVQDNPAMANWARLSDNRDIFDADVEGELKFDKVRVNKRTDKETGKVSFTITGGPRLKITGDFRYETAEGKWKPFGQTTLFTWTSKMSCPSFSLPAGPTLQGGTCPASTPEAIEKEGSYVKYSPPLDQQPAGQAFICDVCYAGKGRYLMYKSMSFKQVAVRKWVDKTLRDGSFTRKMAKALTSLLNSETEELLLSQLVSNQYFRIHDSGDFFSPDYYKAWVEVCRSLPQIHFWAPTRMWVYDKWRRVFLDDPPPPNLALRPSALFTSAPPPTIPELAAGTGSVEGRMDKPVWNCPAYEGEDEHSCAAARCRVCWDAPQKPVNYMTH